MIALDVADLVVIAGRTLGIDTDAALDRIDLEAAQAALDEAGGPALALGVTPTDSSAAAAAGARLVRALLRRPPFSGPGGQQLAVVAGLQFLSLNGWRADLEPPATAAVVVEALASGRLTADNAAAWLAPRLSQAGRPGLGRSGLGRPGLGRPGRGRPGLGRPMAPRPVSWRPVSRRPEARRPALRRQPSRRPARVPAGRALAGALLAVAVTGVSLLAAACSHGVAPAAPTSVVCPYSHGVAPAMGTGLYSPPSGAVVVVCRP